MENPADCPRLRARLQVHRAGGQSRWSRRRGVRSRAIYGRHGLPVRKAGYADRKALRTTRRSDGTPVMPSKLSARMSKAGTNFQRSEPRQGIAERSRRRPDDPRGSSDDHASDRLLQRQLPGSTCDAEAPVAKREGFPYGISSGPLLGGSSSGRRARVEAGRWESALSHGNEGGHCGAIGSARPHFIHLHPKSSANWLLHLLLGADPGHKGDSDRAARRGRLEVLRAEGYAGRQPVGRREPLVYKPLRRSSAERELGFPGSDG